MKIIIADDHPLVLDGLELLLSTFDFVAKTDRAISFPELKRNLSHESYDILFLDIHFGEYDGRTILSEINTLYPTLKIIALTSLADESTIKSSINAGFDGYLLKVDGRDEIENAILAVMNDEKYFSPKTQQIFFNENALKETSNLTARELEILQFIVQEKTTKEIAIELNLSEKTIETHRSNLMLKLDVKNIAGMVREAILQGLVKI